MDCGGGGRTDRRGSRNSYLDMLENLLFFHVFQTSIETFLLLTLPKVLKCNKKLILVKKKKPQSLMFCNFKNTRNFEPKTH